MIGDRVIPAGIIFKQVDPRDFPRLDKLFQLISTRIEANTNHFESLVVVKLVVLFHVGKFGDTGPAPGCPEIDEHDFSTVAGKIKVFSFHQLAAHFHLVAQQRHAARSTSHFLGPLDHILRV